MPRITSTTLKAPAFVLIFASFLILGSSFAPLRAENQAKTLVKDAATKKKLLGKHMLSLQWISWEKFGSATVTEQNGLLTIKGEQRSKSKDPDWLTIDGVITEVASGQFKFKGKIETRVSHINEGKPCLREGEMNFAVKGKRKYWRLKEMDNPCDHVTDYVDIYFK